VRAASKQKWLEVHGIEHWTHFYTDYGLDCRSASSTTSSRARRTAGTSSRRCCCRSAIPARSSSSARERMAARAHAMDQVPSRSGAADAVDRSGRRGVRHLRAAGRRRHLPDRAAEGGDRDHRADRGQAVVSSATEDADLFLVLRVFSPDMKEVTFQGALDPHTPIGARLAARLAPQARPKLTLPYRPYHTHDEKQPLTPGEVYELDIEVWPTCIVVPKGPSAGDLRRQDHAASRRRPRELPVAAFDQEGRQDRQERSQEGGEGRDQDRQEGRQSGEEDGQEGDEESRAPPLGAACFLSLPNGSCAHAPGKRRQRGVSDAKRGATGFPPPLWGRDREGGGSERRIHPHP
jgi:hypothetical protein